MGSTIFNETMSAIALNTYCTLCPLHRFDRNLSIAVTVLNTFKSFQHNHNASDLIFFSNIRKIQLITILKFSHIPSSRPTDGRCPTKSFNKRIATNFKMSEKDWE